MPKNRPLRSPCCDTEAPGCRRHHGIAGQRSRRDCADGHAGPATYDRRLMANLINLERVTVGFGTRTLLDGVSLGVDDGDAIGVVGSNGDGTTTLLHGVAGTRPPDSAWGKHSPHLSVGSVPQVDGLASDSTIRDVIVGGRPDH